MVLLGVLRMPARLQSWRWTYKDDENAWHLVLISMVEVAQADELTSSCYCGAALSFALNYVFFHSGYND